jgi:hypothetical protein
MSKLPDRQLSFDFARTMCIQEKSSMHFSHLHQYVSAYETNEPNLLRLELQIIDAFIEVKRRGVGHEMVDQDGEMSLMCCAGGQIILMLPWKRFDGVIEMGIGHEPMNIQQLTVDEMRQFRKVVEKKYVDLLERLEKSELKS